MKRVIWVFWFTLLLLPFGPVVAALLYHRRMRRMREQLLERAKGGKDGVA